MTMPNGRDRHQRWVVALLRDARNRLALARNPLIVEAARDADPILASERRAALARRMPSLVDALIAELAAESHRQRRRFEVLRRNDVERQPQETIARDIGLSRSQFFRDLREARERLASALQDRLASGVPSAAFGERGTDARFVAIDALRDGGRYERGCHLATSIARDGSAPDAVLALCMRGELETEMGRFAAATATFEAARARLADLPGDRNRRLLDARLTIAGFEADHGRGAPPDERARLALARTLRAGVARTDPDRTALLVRALAGEASIHFQQGDAARAREAIDEASALVERERLRDGRLAVDVKVRASGIHALHPDGVSTALNETAEIVALGRRTGDARSLRLGLQMTAAHLMTLGRLNEAKHFALEAWMLIDLFGTGLDRAIVLSNLARIDVLRGDGREALAWIRLARAEQCGAAAILHGLTICEAEALVLIREARRGVGILRALASDVDAHGRLVGRAKVAEAIALAAADRTREARACSDAAVELSRANGSPLLRLRALDLNVKLTGSARSSRALRELRDALGSYGRDADSLVELSSSPSTVRGDSSGRGASSTSSYSK